MNRLAHQTSPYLRQHADNPVDWWPWCPEAFAEAAERDVPVMLSVGYSACHWCHVMAHESFEDPTTAETMNELFVNIKVDREERPDVDAVYMEAVQALTGHGGWPMTVFLTPSGEPFFGGTYFPKTDRGGLPGFRKLCRAVSETWHESRGDLLDQAERLTASLGRMGRLAPGDATLDDGVLDRLEEQLSGEYDAEWGGFGRAPKFPQAMNLDALLHQHHRTGSEPALAMVTGTLEGLASGGIRDHLGGGYARYSVDPFWMVPHFEKMLYDQATIGRVLLHAWQATGDARWRSELDDLVGYVLRDLRQPGPGFASAEDADSEGEEGRFYVWRPEEIRAVLGDEADAAMTWWGVSESGNFEGSNILHRPERGDVLRPAAIEAARQRLFDARESRVRPLLDDKVLTEWNGLMISLLAEAGAVLGRPDWIDAGAGAARFLLDSLRDADGRWLRSWQADAGARHRSTAADLAAVCDAFVRLYEATGQPVWLDHATDAADELVTNYEDPDRGGFWTTAHDAEPLVVRPKDLLDNAVPSANSAGALALARLGALTGDGRWTDAAQRAIAIAAGPAHEHPSAFGVLLAAVDVLARPMEIVVSGDRPDLVTSAQAAFTPTAVLAWGEPMASPLWEGRGAEGAYVCRQFTCDAPVHTVDDLTQALRRG